MFSRYEVHPSSSLFSFGELSSAPNPVQVCHVVPGTRTPLAIIRTTPPPWGSKGNLPKHQVSLLRCIANLMSFCISSEAGVKQNSCYASMSCNWCLLNPSSALTTSKIRLLLTHLLLMLFRFISHWDLCVKQTNKNLCIADEFCENQTAISTR